MIGYDDALSKVLENVSPLTPREIPLAESAGLVLAGPARARWDMPRCDNAAMDGFALAGGPELSGLALTIIGASYAGHLFAGRVQPGQAVRITTGACLPEGADTVVPIEDVGEKAGQIHLTSRPTPGQHVRCRGEEYREGEVLVDIGTTLHAGAIALLASAGVEKVLVVPRPRVAILSTGDELVELGQQPGPGQIINSNLPLLKARLNECGCTPVCVGIGADDPETLDCLLDQALEADMVLTTGGVSVGEKDHVLTSLALRNFRKVFWKVAIKPGKPVLFGRLDGKPLFGLPGNPAATAATFELFVKPALKKMAGAPFVGPETRRGVLTKEVVAGGKRQQFLWCQLTWHENHYRVAVSDRQGSGQNRSLVGANALIAVPVGTQRLERDSEVEVILL